MFAAGPDVFAFRMDDGKQWSIVAFNTSGAGFRPLAAQAGGGSFGGGDGRRDPLVMDETAVVVLPAAPHSD